MAQIRISDTGVGISPELLSHIFDDFRQENSSVTRRLGGLKLGLAFAKRLRRRIARNLIELHGGTITAESPGIDQGVTFTVRLPFKTNSPFTK